MFRINHVVDLDGDGDITEVDYQTTVPTADSLTFTCADIGIQTIQLWVGDEAGNWDYCVAFIDVQDNAGNCSITSRVGGNIATSKGEGVMNVEVELSGNASNLIMTDENGIFEFNGLLPFNDYTISPFKNTEVANGVSTFDIFLISKHVLNVEPITSPYYMIAADVNRSGSISTLDIVEVRKVVLRVSNQFRNNTSWRFVDKDFIFQNPDDPFDYPEVINYNNITTSQISTDFVAIKIGDVSGDAKTDNFSGIEDRTGDQQILNIESTTQEVGTSQTVRFSFEDASALQGFQFTIDFDPSFLAFENIFENELINERNFGFSMVDEGVITVSWDGVSTDELFFDLNFRTLQDADLSEILRITSQHTPIEIFEKQGIFKKLSVQFDGQVAQDESFILYQNKPNPFSEETLIGFELPESTEIKFTVFDLSGRVLKLIDEVYSEGYNEIRVSKDELQGTGVYYYRLETAGEATTIKMMLIK